MKSHGIQSFAIFTPNVSQNKLIFTFLFSVKNRLMMNMFTDRIKTDSQGIIGAGLAEISV